MTLYGGCRLGRVLRSGASLVVCLVGASAVALMTGLFSENVGGMQEARRQEDVAQAGPIPGATGRVPYRLDRPASPPVMVMKLAAKFYRRQEGRAVLSCLRAPSSPVVCSRLAFVARVEAPP